MVDDENDANENGKMACTKRCDTEGLIPEKS